MDGGAWWAIVHGVSKSRTQLSDFTFFHFMESAWKKKTKTKYRTDLMLCVWKKKKRCYDYKHILFCE